MKKFKQFLIEQQSKPMYSVYLNDTVADMSHPVHRAADAIHKAWMSRNPKQDWNAAQHVDYRDLPQEEQAKDIEHVRTVEDLIHTIPVPEGGYAKDHREAVANAFGSIQHENWRKSFDPEGTGKERRKKVKSGGEADGMVNINVPWTELHPEWKQENYDAGLAAFDAHRTHVGSSQY